jgi:GR25 family glycosyltransferase involved in LPS biosynthesis
MIKEQIKCYCISLKENEDEREWCSKVYTKNKLDVEFFIVERSKHGGSHGCFQSHINVLKKALETDYEYFMILEEDAYFDYNDVNIFNQIFDFVRNIKDNRNWCFCLGYFSQFPATNIQKGFVTIPKCFCAHAYIVNRRTTEQLITMEWKNSPYDIHWHDIIDIFYAPYPMIAFQKDHISSISSDFGSKVMNTIGYRNVATICEVWTQMNPF